MIYLLFKILMKIDPYYANTWHDNIACCIMDEGIDHTKANKIASRIMKHCFNIKTKNPKERILNV